MEVIAHILPSGAILPLQTDEPFFVFPVDGCLELILDTERDCSEVPFMGWRTEQGRIVGAVVGAKVTFADSPIMVVYHLDASDRDKIIMVGLYGAKQGQITRAARVCRAFEKWIRKGGPTPTPDEKNLEILLGWYDVQGDEIKEAYAQRQGTTAKTLRVWEDELRQKGLLK